MMIPNDERMCVRDGPFTVLLVAELLNIASSPLVVMCHHKTFALT